MAEQTLFRRGQALTARLLNRMIADTFMATVIGGGGIKIRRFGDRVIVDGGRLGRSAIGTSEVISSKWVTYST